MVYPYKRIRISNNATRDEHRLVMEKYLCRRLLSNEFVRWVDKKINKIKSDLSEEEFIKLCKLIASKFNNRQIYKLDNTPN